ncbi:hypothetical protein [Noviherbaspirillum malthae]|uniref:hypothetical protein n=1 Tax=Noviherbaspirillum malthae TaxID=1260987 RepID=UPI00188F4D98|nr:hypothetical protein [Noviherbaspirillum malthae]
MNTEIEVLESQYRTARHHRRQAKETLDALSPEFQSKAELWEHLDNSLTSLWRLGLRDDYAQVRSVFDRLRGMLQTLTPPYIEADKAYKAAVHAEEECKKRLDEAERAASQDGQFASK